MNEQRAIDILAGRERSIVGSAMRSITSLLEPVYQFGINRKNKQFDAGNRESAQLPRPTISVGNITTGGTGKTPMVIEVCRRLIAAGQRPCVLTRGYKSKEGLSDEAILISKTLGDDVVVQVNPDRMQGAANALTINESISVFVLDDGFQHRQAKRDLDIVLIDALVPFGYDHLLPRGLLREPVASLGRADLIIITRCDQLQPTAIGELEKTIRQHAPNCPIVQSEFVWSALKQEDEQQPIEALQDKNVAGICGIGNPAVFLAMLRKVSKSVVYEAKLDDHHEYSKAELSNLFAKAKAGGSDAIVTTEKDFVKWPTDAIPDALPVYRPVLQTQVTKGEETFGQMLLEVAERD